jgi:hypothetical protein
LFEFLEYCLLNICIDSITRKNNNSITLAGFDQTWSLSTVATKANNHEFGSRFDIKRINRYQKEVVYAMSAKIV